MNPVKPISAVVCGLILVGGLQALPAYAQDDHSTHAAHATPAPVPAQRWATDAPLREGMDRVRVALDDLRHYEMGHMPANMAVERATAIEDAIAYMFANCKLEPKPDAALHGILVPLLTAAQGLKKDPQDMATVAAMRKAVADYPVYFEDSKWKLEGEAGHTGH